MRELHFSDGVAQKVMDGFFSILLEGQIRRFKLTNRAQRFLSVHDLVQNLFRLRRHRLTPVPLY